MTERDAVRSVVEKSITRTEELRAWAKAKCEKAHTKLIDNTTNDHWFWYHTAEQEAYWQMIQKIDELEAKS